MGNFTDEQLVAKYLKKDEEALEELVRRYLPLIFGFVKKYTGNQDNASDITQETFVKVWKNIKKFDRTKSFKTWIFTIAKRTTIDWLKKKNALPFSVIEEQWPDFSENIKDDSALVAIENGFLQKDFGFALGQLPNSYNSVIKLRVYGGLNFREIAQSLKEPLDTVKSRYRRGLVLLKQLL